MNEDEAETADPVLGFFTYEHLRGDLQDTSRQFAMLANWIVVNLPNNIERRFAMRKLLEAKDCAVRARLT